jgi:DNA (cytosine-5)-methyltransferase 1
MSKRNPIIRTWLDDAIIADNFAGGGGASSGIEQALGRSPDIAVNHDPEAIAMHAANHPSTRHYVENVWEIDPARACGGKPVGIAWFSPTCSHFSKAKGTALDASSVKIRGLAWVAIRWAASVKPRIIALENVEEFEKWGPLHRDHTDGCEGAACAKGCRFGTRAKNPRGGNGLIKHHAKGCPGVACAKDCRIHKPIKAREGETFLAFVKKLRAYYQHVEWRQLRACDFGAPTTRKRLFLLASDQPIAWPQPTHGPSRAQPYRTAAECIDWTLPCPSIFERDKPLKDKTLARIARGIRKFVLENPRPFIVPPAYGDKGGKDVRVNDSAAPMPTICGQRGGHAVIVPYLVHRSNGERPGQAPRIYDVNEPLRTVVAGGEKHAACVAMLIKHNGGNNDAHGSSGQHLDRPMDTLATHNTKAVTVAHLVRYNSENSNGSARGQQCELPLSTLDTANRFGLVASHLVKLRGTSDAHLTASASSLEEPVPTVSASGTHIAQVAAFLVRYNGESTGQEATSPLGTVDTTDRYGLATVTIDGEDYVVADIGMRMLTPRELYRAQGFSDDYQIQPTWNGKPLSKTAQIRMVGNSVCPPIAAAILRAQLGLEVDAANDADQERAA